jgi:hypothetical protein
VVSRDAGKRSPPRPTEREGRHAMPALR